MKTVPHVVICYGGTAYTETSGSLDEILASQYCGRTSLERSEPFFLGIPMRVSGGEEHWAKLHLLAIADRAVIFNFESTEVSAWSAAKLVQDLNLSRYIAPGSEPCTNP